MVVISARGLGKEYKLGAQMHDTLRDQITALIRGRRQSPAEKFWALRDVDFDVEQGDCVGIVGRNGAGKSTLLKILSQITEPTEGEIRIRGRVASVLVVGTGFHSELTGRENTFLNGAILGMTRAEITRKFDQIAAFAEMDAFLDTPVKHYSSGMTTRLAFSVAAHLDPEILIIDEVLAVGDAAFQKKCLGRMNEVARAGRTVLFVSHNMSAVTALCTRGLYLEHGRLKAAGTDRRDRRDLSPGCLASGRPKRFSAGARPGERSDHLYRCRGGFGDLVRLGSLWEWNEDLVQIRSDAAWFGRPIPGEYLRPPAIAPDVPRLADRGPFAAGFSPEGRGDHGAFPRICAHPEDATRWN